MKLSPFGVVLAFVAAVSPGHGGVGFAATPAGEELDAQTLVEGCEKLAEIVAATLEQEGVDPTVIVGTFASVPRLQSSGGVGLAHRVGEALNDRGVRVATSDAYQLNGEFSSPRRSPKFEGTSQAGPEEIALRIEYVIRDRDDAEKRRGVVNIFGDGPLAIVGSTASFRPDQGRTGAGSSPEDPARVQMLRLEDAIRNPRAFVAGTEIRADGDSPYGIEIVADTRSGSAAAARVPEIRNDRAFVRLAAGEEYRIRLHNRADGDVAVSLLIDGLDVFSFQDRRGDGRSMKHFILEPRQVNQVDGWYIDERHADAFEITGYSKSAAAAKLRSIESVGVITAIFFDANEIRTKAVQTTQAEPNATGRGRRLEQSTEIVERVIGRPLAVISVRYDRP